MLESLAQGPAFPLVLGNSQDLGPTFPCQTGCFILRTVIDHQNFPQVFASLTHHLGDGLRKVVSWNKCTKSMRVGTILIHQFRTPDKELVKPGLLFCGRQTLWRQIYKEWSIV